jgi:ubiquinone/menaquinone biosynthesis C-methylase UbiE
MSNPTNPRREHPNTYFVQDRSNEEELARLRIQDQIVTAGMGGVLPEQDDPTRFQRVLDVGCGTGGWLIQTALTYPSISLLAGVDASGKMIDYARSEAQAHQVTDRVEFHGMDALLILAFPDRYFDLVNMRSGASWIRTWEWPKLIDEYKRVCRREGVIRVTEGAMSGQSNSPALNRFFDLMVEAFNRSGHLFTPERNGLIQELPHLLYQHGVQYVQARTITLEFRAGTPEGERFAEDQKLGWRTALPFFRRWLEVPEDYEDLGEQALTEMRQPDFVATWEMVTVWGTSPGYDLRRRD